MARTHGSLNRTTKQINDVIKSHFARTNKDGTYLDDLARDDKNLYIALVLKVMPQQVAVDVKHHVDLASAMLQAEQRRHDLALTIDHQPSAPTSIVHHEPVVPKPLETKDTALEHSMNKP